MIITKQKNFDDLLKMMDGQSSVFIVGCGECATTCRTGGEKEVAEMSLKLTEKGKTITGSVVINAPCLELDTRRVLRQNKDAIEKTEGILVLACGAGIQSVAEAVSCKVYPGCDSLFLGNVFRHQHFYEKCSTCGDCVVENYGGICPVTRCPKSLLNGPCGGSIQGKCEVDSEKECIWIMIYDKMKKSNTLNKLKKVFPVKRHGAGTSPGVVINGV
ncbi:MAG: methylenetetrahydrofolate reductase C-terminal domain-containing protein [Nitrospinae bacterium]|nr:methylenetetrahydrofolate reductase C-terminal domain-containing protein [Nitrospinota bacterium]